MSKKKWLFTFMILAVFAYLIISKVAPGWALSIDNTLGPSISGGIDWTITAVTTSWVWQNWGNYISFAIGGVFIGVIFWKGHNAYNKVRGTMVKSAAKEAYGWQSAPPSQPQPVPPKPTPKAEPTPVPPLPAEVELKEEVA